MDQEITRSAEEDEVFEGLLRTVLRKGLLTKTFQGHARPSLWIDWQLLRHGSLEDKLSFMTALVLSAEKQGQKYGLRLPGKVIEQSYGNAHRNDCLQTLAVFKQSDPERELPLASD